MRLEDIRCPPGYVLQITVVGDPDAPLLFRLVGPAAWAEQPVDWCFIREAQNADDVFTHTMETLQARIKQVKRGNPQSRNG